ADPARLLVGWRLRADSGRSRNHDRTARFDPEPTFMSPPVVGSAAGRADIRTGLLDIEVKVAAMMRSRRRIAPCGRRILLLIIPPRQSAPRSVCRAAPWLI